MNLLIHSRNQKKNHHRIAYAHFKLLLQVHCYLPHLPPSLSTISFLTALSSIFPLHFRLKLKACVPYMTHISCIHPLIPKVCQFCISLELLRINFSLSDSSHHGSKTLQPQRVLTLPFVLFTTQSLSPTVFFFLIPSGKSVLSTHKKDCLLLARPQTISTSSFSCMKTTLPTLTQITDLGVCLSSHAMQ